MSSKGSRPYGAHARIPEETRPSINAKKRVPAAAILAIIAIVACAIFAAGFFMFASQNSKNVDGTTLANNESALSGSNLFDKDMTGRQSDSATLKTPIVATINGIKIRSAIVPEEVTGILFHQASFEDALPMETKLKQADAAKAYKKHSIPINREQKDVSGWADAEVLHLYRDDATTLIDTSIDIGAVPGTTVYAPMSGTVVLVKKYMLYNETPDYRIHIQPNDHPELDCTILHISDPLVTAGDNVEAGITPIAFIRDISSHITEIQLNDFTKDGGNHAHVQISDANDVNYRKRTMEGAIFTGIETEEQIAAQNAADNAKSNNSEDPPDTEDFASAEEEGT